MKRRPRTPEVLCRVALAVGMLALVLGAGAGAGAGADASVAQERPDRHGSGQRTVVRYGPVTVPPPCTGPGPCDHANFGGVFELDVEKPCTDCYLTSMRADLVKADGTRATVHDGLQLRQLELFNAGRTDAACESSFTALGQRFFVTGDGRQVQSFPAGYGYQVGTEGAWNLYGWADNTTDVPQTVSFEVTFEWVRASTPGMSDVEPVVIDVAPCRTVFISTPIPAGPSSLTGTWTVNRPGDVVAVSGHLLDHGRRVTVRNETTGRRICTMRAGYGETPDYVDADGVAHLSSMTSCGSRHPRRPVARLAEGQQVTVTSHYDAPVSTLAATNAAILYVARHRPLSLAE